MKKLLFLSLCLLVLLSSCDRTFKKSDFGLQVTGKVGEILVVCEKGIWESDVKAYLDTNLTQFIMPYFPDVTTFELIHRTPQMFEGGNKRWRNLMFVSIDPKIGETQITKEKNTWATGQLVVKIIAKDMNSLIEACKTSLQNVHQEFDTTEWMRLLERFEGENHKVLQKRIQKGFGFNISLPRGSSLVSHRNNFYRIAFPTDTKPLEFDGGNGQTANFIQSGILIYQYDFIDSSQFELPNLLMARDTMLKYNVPHEIDGIYMGTQYAKVVYPEGNLSWNKNHSVFGYEMRGMYRFLGKKDYSTGGAFWSFHFISKKNKLVCVSGYVDCPPTISWTLPLREIQAVLKSIDWK